MRTFTTLLAASATLASTVVAADVNGLLSTLTSLNLTSLVGAATTIANTTGGARLLGVLGSNTQITLLAPTNNAFAGVNAYFANDPVWLQQALAYHVIIGNVPVSSIPTAPNNAIFPTALNDTNVVKHLGDTPQSIGLVRVGNSSFVTNQNDYPARVLRSATYQNVLIHVVSTVVDLPPSLLDALTLSSYPWTSNLTSLTQFAPPAIIDSLATSKSVTLFAPNNQALIDAVNFGHVSANISGTELDALILNHVVNGTVLFTGSPQTTYTSGAGEAITFGQGGAFGYVVYYRGQLVANVVYPNIITQSGVLHIIDAVLPNTAENLPAATSAYSAASVKATSSATPQRRAVNPSRFWRSY